ncbi:hypothetical protein AVEN_216441-1 [Araneus ventricosus]|uniref:Uncharacterized protein n=1 Tax=Araneus ventricosus TaxID=182803 RepID=A0A4Y2BLF8_ARAVE|nr:hypothetical protein AVEN_216441-1 [Araneus ventricosus]
MSWNPEIEPVLTPSVAIIYRLCLDNRCPRADSKAQQSSKSALNGFIPIVVKKTNRVRLANDKGFPTAMVLINFGLTTLEITLRFFKCYPGSHQCLSHEKFSTALKEFYVWGSHNWLHISFVLSLSLQFSLEMIASLLPQTCDDEQVMKESCE